MELLLTFSQPTPPASTAMLGYNALDHGFVRDGVFDNSAVWDAFVALLDVNRAGNLVFPQGRYFFSQTPHIPASYQGTALLGEGVAGVGSSLARGSTQFIIGDGQWGLQLGDAQTSTWRGFRVEDIQFYEQNVGGALGGVLMLRTNDCRLTGVSCGDFTAGKGFVIDGTGDNAQYNTLIDCRAGTCLTACELKAANATRFVGGFFEGTDTVTHPNIAPGSVGLRIINGDTTKAMGLTLQGYDVLLDVTGGLFHELDVRYEDWTTSAARVRTGVMWTALEGNADNSVNGALGSGIVIDSGAQDTYDNVAVRNVTNGARHVNNGTRTMLGQRAT